jgi:N-acetylmuramoyl-L-alanine amidase
MDSLLTSSHLDAGHGGHDFGAVYNGHVEKK